MRTRATPWHTRRSRLSETTSAEHVAQEMRSTGGEGARFRDYWTAKNGRDAAKYGLPRGLWPAHRGRQLAQWVVTEGHDAQRRQVAITAAVQSGRLPASELLELPAPREPVALLGCKAAVPPQIAVLRDEFAARIRVRSTMGDGHAKAACRNTG